MNKKLLAIVTATSLLLSAWITGYTQDEDAAPYVTPVDTFTCTFNEGKDAGDLDDAVASWNEWMDQQGATEYGAFTITPYYYGADTFDIGWLGFWTSQEAMGAGIDGYMANGGEIEKGFDEVLTCETHSHWASINIKSPGEGPAPDNLVLMFSDCSLKNEDGYDELFASLKKAVAYQTENGFENGTWMMWPVFGGGGESKFDFKVVSAWDNYTSFGKAYQHNANDGGRQALNEIMGDQLDCDTSRVYNAKAVRKVTAPVEE